MEVKFSDILNIYEKEISLGIKNKKRLFNFERNKIQNLVNIYFDIKENNYTNEHYNIFLVNEPKKRIIMSLNVHDKIINHYATEFILIPKLEKYLDMRNIATRKGMGSDYGIKLIKKYLEAIKKYNNAYVLKLDISKYFYNIDHEILKDMLIDKLDAEEFNFMCNIIDSTNESYINEQINKFCDASLPNYEYNKGLPIGNLTSQFLSIFYLHALDHYIVHDLHLKYYVRYMDDFIIIHEDKKYLEECLIKIKDKITKDYKLKVNEKKTQITDLKEGFIFLGYKFKVIDKKTIVKIRQETFKKVKKRIGEVNYLYETNRLNFASYFASISNYKYSLKYANSFKIECCINENY